MVGSLLAGLITAVLVAGLLLLAAGWYRQHLWLVWTTWDLRFFYLAGLLAVIGPAAAVGLLAERRSRLRAALSCQYAELEAVHGGGVDNVFSRNGGCA